MEAATVRILVEANSSGVATGLAAGSAAVRGFEQVVSSTMARVNTAFGALTGGQKLFAGTATGLALLVTGIKAVVGPAIEFESAFSGVKKTVDGTPAQFDAIRQGLLDMSSVMPVAANDLAEIAENAGQLGVAAPDVLNFTETVAKLGATTDLTFDAASTKLARFISITGNSTDVVDELGSVLVGLGNNFAATESEILAFSTRLAPAATAAGLTADQIAGIGAAFIELGQPIEAGSTAIARVLTEMDDAVKRSTTSLDVFADVAGVTGEEFQNIFKDDPAQALLLFEQGLGRVQDASGSVVPILEELGLNSQRVQAALQAGAEGSDRLAAALGLSAGEMANATLLNEEYGKVAETTASRLQTLGNRITAVRISLGTPLLATLALGADVAGDAIARLVEIISPLGSEIGAAFSNAGTSASAFYDVIGSPAIGVAADSLGILTSVLTELVSGFNSLGPAGFILAALAADIALVGPVSVAAAAGLAALRTGATGMTAAMAGGQAVLNSFVGSINPVAAAAAIAGVAFFEMTREMREIQSAADEAGAAIQNDLNAALEAGDAQAFSAGIAETRTELEGLQARLDGFDGFTKFDQGIAELLGNVSGVNEEFASTKAEIEALEGVLQDDAVVAYSANIERLGEQFGITEDEIIAAATASGDLSILFQSGLPAVEAQVAAMEAYVSGVAELGAIAPETAAAIFDQSASVDQYAEALGLSVNQLQALASTSASIDFEDFFSEDPAVRAAAFAAALQQLEGSLGPIAAQLGVTTDAILDQVGATNQLAAAHSDLRNAVDAARAGLAAYGEQQRIAEESSAQFEEALAGVTDAASFEEAAAAMRVLVTDVAALGDAAAAANLESQLTAQLFEAGVAAGLTTEQIVGMIGELGSVDAATIAALAAEGQIAQGAMEELNATVTELARQELSLQIGLEGADEVISTLEQAGVAATEIPAVLSILMAAEGADEVSQILTDIGVSARDIPTLVQLILEAQDNASEEIGRVAALAGGFAISYDALLSATDTASPTIGQVAALAGGYAIAYNAALTASDEGASPTIGQVAALAGGYAIAYNASITASDDGASGEIATQTGAANAYATGYNAGLTASDDGASGQISTLAGSANAYARAYNATLTAVDNASNVINRAVAALTGFRSKRITITTRYQSFFAGNNGGITGTPSGGGGGSSASFADGGINRYDGGGIDLSAGVPETSGRAKIYSPAATFRVHSEPETGGEAYIPLARRKRNASIPIWLEAGKWLGVFADGGIQSFQDGGLRTSPLNAPARVSGDSLGLQINAPISVQVDARGMNEREVVELVSAGVSDGLDSAARRLANRRF